MAWTSMLSHIASTMLQPCWAVFLVGTGGRLSYCVGEAFPYLVMFLHLHLFPGAQVLSPCKLEYTTPQHTNNDPAFLSFQLVVSFKDLYVNNLVPSSWHFGKIVKTLRFGALWEDSTLGGDGNLVFSSLLFPLDMRTAPHAATLAGQTVGSVCYRMKPFLCMNHCFRPLLEIWETLQRQGTPKNGNIISRA